MADISDVDTPTIKDLYSRLEGLSCEKSLLYMEPLSSFANDFLSSAYNDSHPVLDEAKCRLWNLTKHLNMIWHGVFGLIYCIGKKPKNKSDSTALLEGKYFNFNFTTISLNGSFFLSPPLFPSPIFFF
jgi:hypothetical protein